MWAARCRGSAQRRFTTWIRTALYTADSPQVLPCLTASALDASPSPKNDHVSCSQTSYCGQHAKPTSAKTLPTTGRESCRKGTPRAGGEIRLPQRGRQQMSLCNHAASPASLGARFPFGIATGESGVVDAKNRSKLMSLLPRVPTTRFPHAQKRRWVPGRPERRAQRVDTSFSHAEDVCCVLEPCEGARPSYKRGTACIARLGASLGATSLTPRDQSERVKNAAELHLGRSPT